MDYISKYTGEQIDNAINSVIENSEIWNAAPTVEEMNAAIPTKTSQLINDNGYLTTLPATENWTFTFEDGVEIDKAVYIDEEGASSSQNKGLICKIADGISVIDAGLTYTRGVVEVRKIGSILWIIDSGVYNFTDSFTASKNRTVLQFDLPKAISNKIHNVNGAYGGTGTIGYSPALAYENVTYTTFNCQSYLKRSAVGDTVDTYQLVYTGLDAVNGGGLCGFHLKMPIMLIDAEG